MIVVERKRLIIVVYFGQIRIGEYVGQQSEFSALSGLDPTVRIALPAPVPMLLILPIFGIADTWFGFDIIEPRIFHTVARGPDIFTVDRTGMTADTFVRVQYHRNLCPNLPSSLRSILEAYESRTADSSQSIFDIYRTITNSSRLEHTVP